MSFPYGEYAGSASGRHQLSDAELAAGSTPFEELDDYVWTDHCPIRPVHHRVAGEWPDDVPTWSFIVEDGWEDHTQPPLELAQAPLEPQKPVTRRKRKPRRSRPTRSRLLSWNREQAYAHEELWCGTEIIKPLAQVVEAQRPAWSGRPNAWAQACSVCGEVVPVGAGFFRSTGSGWEAVHRSCSQDQAQPI
jgi:hypothetical protein